MNKYAYNLKEASQATGYGVRALRNRIHKGEIKASKSTPNKQGRLTIPASELKRIINEGMIS